MDKKRRPMSVHLGCPWCGKGETLADGRGKITISVQCRKCGFTYLADLDRAATERATPQRRQGRARAHC